MAGFDEHTLVGTPVLYTDQVRVQHDALLTGVWQEDEHGPSYVNLVYVVSDKSKTDSCGRQTERATSVPRKAESNAAGRHFELV